MNENNKPEKKSSIKSNIKIGLICLVVGVAFLLLALWMFSDDSILLGTMELAGSIAAFAGTFFSFKSVVLEIKTTFTEKQKRRLVVSCCAILIFALLCYCFVDSFVSSTKLNSKMEKFVGSAVNESTVDTIVKMDKEIAQAGLFRNLFLKYMDEYDAIKSETEVMIANEAQRITDGIANWETPVKIESASEYQRLTNQLDKLTLNDNILFEKKVKAAVANYNELAQHKSDFDTLVDSYQKDCSSCSGRGRKACQSCNGMGKKGVKFYSEGDWGYTSYSNYKCTSCNGSGKKHVEVAMAVDINSYLRINKKCGTNIGSTFLLPKEKSIDR